MTKLEDVLETLDELAQVAEFFPPASAYAKLSDTLLQIAIKTNATHQALFGKPLDYTLIKPYTPVPLQTTAVKT